MSPALRPVREVMEKLDRKPEPQPLPAQGKRVEPSWRMARNRVAQRRAPLTTKSTARPPHLEQTSRAAQSGNVSPAP